MSHWLDKVIELLRADTKDLRELAKIADGDPAIFYRGIDLHDLEWEDQDISGMEFASSEDFLNSIISGSRINIGVNENILIYTGDLTTWIKKFKRQEERISLILRLILEHRGAAIAILEQYGMDSAKYATVVINELLQAFYKQAREEAFVEEESSQLSLTNVLHQIGKMKPKRLTDDGLVKIVHRAFQRNLPSNRSALLFYMAKHLSGFPEVNEFLRLTIARSRSAFVAPEREHLLLLLDNPSPPSWLDLLEIPYVEADDEPIRR